MSTQQIPIQDATAEQLRGFAESYLGIPVPANAKAETIRSKIAQAWTKDHIVIHVDSDEEALPKAGAPRPVTAQQQPPGPEKVRIMIQVTNDTGGDRPVPVGVNGRIMLIPRGEQVDIPLPYFEVLQQAITHTFDSLPGGGINPIPRKVPAYPFHRIA